MNLKLTPTPTEAPESFLADLLLSLNLGATILFGALLYVMKSATSFHAVNDSDYLAFRSICRVADFLKLQTVNPVSTGTVRRELPGNPEQWAAEIALLVSGFAAVAMVFLILRLLHRADIGRGILRITSLPMLLFAGPAAYLLISWVGWERFSWAEPEPAADFRYSPLFLLCVTEFLCLCVTFFRPRRWGARWAISIFAILHWSCWMAVLWRATEIVVYRISARDLFLVFFPMSTLLWVWREQPLIDRLGDALSRRWIVVHTFQAAAIVLAVALWHPSRNVELSHPRDWRTVEVELSRGPCFGSCAAYTITVRGDRQVEYVGRERHARAETRKSGTIEQEKISEILQTLDGVEFTALDGRAFRWAFDTSSIGVSVSVDGKSKEVVSDTYTGGAKVGRQARFLEAANKVDSILRETVWSKCEGEDCGAAKRK